MKLLTFLKEGNHALGIKTDKGIIDVEAASKLTSQTEAPTDIMDVIQQSEAAVKALAALEEAALSSGDSSVLLDEEGLTFAPCVTRPSKIICVGLNYRKHADETNSPYPKTPILFNKFSNALAGHQEPVAVPRVTEKLDYEAELTIVIGKRAKNVDQAEALQYVFGYCNGNDLSARDLQLRTAQWMLGKTCDGFAPIGPYLVTADEVGDPNDLEIKTILNGEVRQQSNTADMIFHCDEIVSYISQHMTLEPGDIIMTGTPEGVIMGYPEDKQEWIKPGDVVTIEIEKLGSLTNRFVADE